MKKNLGICDRIPGFCSEVDTDNLLVLMRHGSHLYGTDTPSSDVDIKGVFMPSVKQILLGKIPKAYSYSRPKTEGERNNSSDVDIQLFSIHYFIEMACQGETLSIDMLHAREDQCIIWTPVWQSIFDQRSMFYTKNMKAFVGYARTQAAKYGIKGSRLDAVKKVIDFCLPKVSQTVDPGKLLNWWDNLPDGEHIHKLDPNPRDKNNNRIYQVCGKQFLENTPVAQMYACLDRFYQEYGTRARLAQENKGIDWKAVSHAFRAAFQLIEIFTTGDLRFPLAQAEYLKQIKRGERDWSFVQADLEKEIANVERLSEQSGYYEKVDRNKINNWLSDIVLNQFRPAGEKEQTT